MRGNVIEIVIGAVVLVVAALFLVFAYRTSQSRTVSGGYEVIADFARIDGIHQGSDVRISGIKVGTVVADDTRPEDLSRDDTHDHRTGRAVARRHRRA